MATVWHYVGEDGARHEEAFTDVQAALDETVVRRFQSLENIVAAEKDPNKGNKELIAQLFEDVSTLPEHRGLHWLEEFERIGLTAPKAAKPAAPAEDAAPAI